MTLKSDIMQIESAKAVCIFHFAAFVISCSPFRVTEETEEKQCIHIALGSRRPGRRIINQRSINTAHNVNTASKLWTLVMRKPFLESIFTKWREMQS